MRRVLLVDDDDEVHRQVRPWLIKSGYAVDHAGNSDEAKLMLGLSRSDHTFDIIVCDNSMQTENEGLEFAASLWLTNVPIPFILYTRADLYEAQGVMKRYKIHHVIKTDTPDALLRKIAEVFTNESAAP